MSSRRGKAFEYEWSRSLREYQARHNNFFWRRWPDHRDWVRINKKLRAPRAPADFVAINEGEFYAFELKSSRASRYLCSWVKEHQRDTLLHIKQAGGHGLIVMNRRKPSMNCWAVDIVDFLWLEAKSYNDNYKSISWNDIAETGTEIPRVKGTWDLSSFFLSEKETP
jgi:penicillin-binding protein-related factor A (putative recombinase)